MKNERLLEVSPMTDGSARVHDFWGHRFTLTPADDGNVCHPLS